MEKDWCWLRSLGSMSKWWVMRQSSQTQLRPLQCHSSCNRPKPTCRRWRHPNSDHGMRHGLAHITVLRQAALAHESHEPWVPEQPHFRKDAASMFRLDEFQELLRGDGVSTYTLIHLAHCRFGSDAEKLADLMSNVDLSDVCLTCNYPIQIWVTPWSGRRHHLPFLTHNGPRACFTKSNLLGLMSPKHMRHIPLSTKWEAGRSLGEGNRNSEWKEPGTSSNPLSLRAMRAPRLSWRNCWGKS